MDSILCQKRVMFTDFVLYDKAHFEIKPYGTDISYIVYF